MRFEIPEHELEIRADPSSGPGGQHVNRSSTRVQIRWNVTDSPSLTEAQRARLLDQLRTRLDRRGVLAVSASDGRSQLRNRQVALERLNQLVADALHVPNPRRKTAPPAAARKARLEDKKKRSEVKRRRRPVDPDE